jgi:predicted O-linked N-acetylglucosamine transferase (SPINDLY family)
MKQSVDQSLRKAASLSAKGAVAEAESIYRDVLQRFPTNKRALDGMRALAAPKDPKAYQKGVEAVLALYDQGRLREALDHLRLLIDLYPSQADLHNLAGAASAGTGQLAAAIDHYDRAIELVPDNAEVHSNRASALIGLRRFEEALASGGKAVELDPGNAIAHSNRGIALRQLGRCEEAVRAQDASLRLNAASPEAWYNRGNALLDLKQADEALASYDEAIALRPTYVLAHNNRGNALRELRRLHEAIDSYSRAIALAPAFAEAHSNLGAALLGLKRIDEALESSRKAVELESTDANVHYNHAVVLQELQRFDAALAAYDDAIRLAPDHADAHGGRGGVLYELHRLDEAAAAHARSVELKPEDAAGHYNLANVLQELERLDEAVDCYTRAIGLQPDYPEAASQLVFQQARMCDWTGGHRAAVPALGIATRAVTPFTFLAIDDDPARHLQRAKKWIGEKYRRISIRPARSSARPGPIRIGYFSADFHDHATMYLLARLLELHDRSRFEVHAFSYGPDRQDGMRRRAVEAVHAFHEVSGLTDKAIAELAKHEGIDIAIDLKGHTKGMRTGIFSHRAAPIQIGYLGYPGSIGADFIDYIIADEIVIPARSRPYYAEKVIALPDSYQVNDDRRAIPDERFSRAELGLPEDGFVFCSFNNVYKIGPAEFDIWMRLLGQVDGSVLWLLRDNRWAEANLRREAAIRGIDPGRLVFAERMPQPDHLARQAQADLFLDSFACNAHTTASDALWAGLPVVTRLGESFAARVAGSLLHAAGLPELATGSAADYERTALDLALDPAKLAAVKAKLATNRSTAPLFDTERYARHIEAAYQMAYDRYHGGLQPDHIVVPRGA